MKEIPLTKGFVALVDDEDYDRLMQHSWYVMKNFNTYYATRTFYPPGEKGKKVTIQMHREVLGLAPGEKILVDHKDRNGLHNTKLNLRLPSGSLSAYNRSFPEKASSPFRGVFLFKNGKYCYWRAAIRVNRVLIHLGSFPNAATAAIAYDQAAIKYFEENAQLNFPEFLL